MESHKIHVPDHQTYYLKSGLFPGVIFNFAHICTVNLPLKGEKRTELPPVALISISLASRWPPDNQVSTSRKPFVKEAWPESHAPPWTTASKKDL